MRSFSCQRPSPQKLPLYAQLESQMETQDEDGDDFDSTQQLFQSVEGDGANNLEYDNDGISDLDDIDLTQSL